MKSVVKTAALTSTAVAALAIGLVGAQSVLAAPVTNQGIEVPSRVDNFQLTDHKRLAHELHYFRTSSAIVLMTQINGSKVSQQAAKELQEIADTYASKGVEVYLLNSNLGQSREDAAEEARKLGLSIPILMDELQLVGESLGVQREAEVFVIDPSNNFEVAYHGPLDDRFAKSRPNPKAKVKKAYLVEALDSVIEDRPVQQARVEAKGGKAIAFPERNQKAQHASISYAEEVVPVLQAKCVTCHQEGGIAPFAMDSYEVVKGFAPMIRESIRTDRMPPYFADPHIGQFKDDQALTADQTKTLVHWIEAGAQRGDGPDRLALEKSRAPEWPAELGEPDVIIDLPEFAVPASGIIEYQNQRVDNPFDEDTWLRAIAIKPGEMSVLHHVVSNWSPNRGEPPAELPGGSVGSYTPGARPQVMADGAGAPIPAGGSLNFQLHYTTTGKPAVDRTQVGFYLLDEKPKYIKRSVVIGDFGMTIPAGEARHEEVAYLEFPADAYLYTLYPHAHYRGWHVELTQKSKDGTETPLISLPKYDFNWQRDYDPIEPIHVKAGDRLIARWVYDNSTNNPANPDPTAEVTWGEQSWEEMMYFRVNYRWADETTDNIRNDLQKQLDTSVIIGGFDEDGDGMVQMSEISGPFALFKPRLAALDTDKDGALSKSELGVLDLRRLFAAFADTPDL